MKKLIEEHELDGMDKLDVIFHMQRKFDEDVAKNRGIEWTSGEWIQKQTLAMISELAELLAEVNFKWWKNPKPVQGFQPPPPVRGATTGSLRSWPIGRISIHAPREGSDQSTATRTTGKR